MPPRTTLRAGDRVAVHWGVDTREGEVSAVYHTGDIERVLVRLDAPEGTYEEEQTVVLPAEAVRLLSDKSDLAAPGTWLRGFRFERAVAEALNQVLANWQPRVQLNAEVSGKEIDALVESSHGIMVVEVKTMDKLSERVLEGAVRQLRSKLNTFPGAKGLLVTRSALPASSAKRVRPDGLLSSDVGVVRWRGPEDNKQLDRVAHALLSDDPDPTVEFDDAAASSSEVLEAAIQRLESSGTSPNVRAAVDGLHALGYLLRPARTIVPGKIPENYLRIIDPEYTAHGVGYLTPSYFGFSRATDRERLLSMPGAEPQTSLVKFSHVESTQPGLEAAKLLKS